MITCVVLQCTCVSNSFVTAALVSIMHLGLATAASSPPVLRVAVDLSFGSLMNVREHRSLLAQILRVYGNNRSHRTPIDLHLTGLLSAPAECLPPMEHLRSWEAYKGATLLQPAADDVWAPDKLVWLSPDAPLVLEEPLLREDRVFVLGGLIDRSVKKGITLKRALASGAEARRLPVREFAPRNDIHPILTLPACVHVLCEMNGGSTWAEAFASAIPQRAIKRRVREEEGREATRRDRRPGRKLLDVEHTTGDGV